MASIGLGLMQGAMLANQAMTENENRSRLQAGRKLFDANLKEAEASAEMLSEMNSSSHTAMKAINDNKERIMLGDPTGTANVLKATIYKDFDGTVTVDPATKQILAIDKDGQVVGKQAALSGMQGVASLMQLSNTIEKTYANQVAAQQLQDQRVYEMTKMREEKTYDYKKAVDVAGIGANASITSAGIGANATLGAAGIKAQVDTYRAQLDSYTKLTEKQKDAEIRKYEADLKSDNDVMLESMKGDVALKGKVIENAIPLQTAAIVAANIDATKRLPTLDSTTGKPELAPMTPQQAATGATNYRSINDYLGQFPTATPFTAAREGLFLGRSDTAVNTNNDFLQNLNAPTVSGLNFYAVDGAAPTVANNFGLNLGGVTLGNAQTTVQQGIADQAAAEADRKARAYEMAKFYGFVK